MFAFRDRRAQEAAVPPAVDRPHQRRLPDARLRYSQFIAGLQLAMVELDRKSLSEIAIHDPDTFTKLVELAPAQPAARRVTPNPTVSGRRRIESRHAALMSADPP